MALSESVFWTQGLFLCPQHLQQSDRHQAGRLGLGLSAASPLPWGVIDLQIDEAALLANKFRVRSLTCVLRQADLGIHYAEGDRDPPGLVEPRVLDDQFSPASRSLDVFIGVPREALGAQPTGPRDGLESEPRHLTATRKLVDDVSPDVGEVDRELDVEVAMLNARVYLGNELQKHGATGIKVAELVRGKGNQLELRREFIPPCRRIAVSKLLIATLGGLRSRAFDAREALIGTTGGHDVEGMFRFSALEQMVVVLDHVLHSQNWMPPETLYLELIRLIGAFGVVGRQGRRSLAAPPFNYEDLGTCLFKTCQLLDTMLGGGVQKFIQIPLELEPGRRFLVGEIEDPRALKGTLYLAVFDGPNFKLVRRSMVISSKSEITKLIDYAIKGIPLEESVPSPPQLPAGHPYLRISTDSERGKEYWPGVASTQSIALHLPKNAAANGIQREWYALYSVL